MAGNPDCCDDLADVWVVHKKLFVLEIMGLLLFFVTPFLHLPYPNKQQFRWVNLVYKFSIHKKGLARLTFSN